MPNVWITSGYLQAQRSYQFYKMIKEMGGWGGVVVKALRY
jgi:hypothetical protein